MIPEDLIVTFLALQSTDILDGDTIHFTGLYIIMKLLVNAVELISGTVCIEVYFRFTVTVNTPSHTQLRYLFHFIHCCDLTMTGLALYLACPHVLRVVKIHVVR